MVCLELERSNVLPESDERDWTWRGRIYLLFKNTLFVEPEEQPSESFNIHRNLLSTTFK